MLKRKAKMSQSVPPVNIKVHSSDRKVTTPLQSERESGVQAKKKSSRELQTFEHSV